MQAQTPYWRVDNDEPRVNSNVAQCRLLKKGFIIDVQDSTACWGVEVLQITDFRQLTKVDSFTVKNNPITFVRNNIDSTTYIRNEIGLIYLNESLRDTIKAECFQLPKDTLPYFFLFYEDEVMLQPSAGLKYKAKGIVPLFYNRDSLDFKFIIERGNDSLAVKKVNKKDTIYFCGGNELIYCDEDALLKLFFIEPSWLFYRDGNTYWIFDKNNTLYKPSLGDNILKWLKINLLYVLLCASAILFLILWFFRIPSPFIKRKTIILLNNLQDSKQTPDESKIPDNIDDLMAFVESQLDYETGNQPDEKCRYIKTEKKGGENYALFEVPNDPDKAASLCDALDVKKDDSEKIIVPLKLMQQKYKDISSEYKELCKQINSRIKIFSDQKDVLFFCDIQHYEILKQYCTDPTADLLAANEKEKKKKEQETISIILIGLQGIKCAQEKEKQDFADIIADYVQEKENAVRETIRGKDQEFISIIEEKESRIKAIEVEKNEIVEEKDKYYRGEIDKIEKDHEKELAKKEEKIKTIEKERDDIAEEKDKYYKGKIDKIEKEHETELAKKEEIIKAIEKERDEKEEKKDIYYKPYYDKIIFADENPCDKRALGLIEKGEALFFFDNRDEFIPYAQKVLELLKMGKELETQCGNLRKREKDNTAAAPLLEKAFIKFDDGVRRLSKDSWKEWLNAFVDRGAFFIPSNGMENVYSPLYATIRQAIKERKNAKERAAELKKDIAIALLNRYCSALLVLVEDMQILFESKILPQDEIIFNYRETLRVHIKKELELEINDVLLLDSSQNNSGIQIVSKIQPIPAVLTNEENLVIEILSYGVERKGTSIEKTKVKISKKQ